MLASQLWEKVELICLSLLALLILATLMAIYYQRSTSTGMYRRDYEGEVVDKFVSYHESQTGTGIERHFLIKGKSGEQFQVVVGKELYERARIGMWIKSSQAGVELSESGF